MRYVSGNIDREQTNFLPMIFDEMIGENNQVKVINKGIVKKGV